MGIFFFHSSLKQSILIVKCEFFSGLFDITSSTEGSGRV